MGELVIKRHDFEEAKEKIKEFSEQATMGLDLNQVEHRKDAGEFLGDFFLGRGIGLDHKVTGEELNQLTGQIQEHLQKINSTQIKLVETFGQVYLALEGLDRDYIKAILVSIKATEKTSESIQETQGQIKKIVENQRKTLEELKKFKTKLDGYTHLVDIDQIWVDCQRCYGEINSLSRTIDDAIESSMESVKRVDAMESALNQGSSDTTHADVIQQSNAGFKALEKKVKCIYLIAGGAAGLAIIELLVLLMKVI